MGLQWVQEHIAAFGGDPRRVTVGGESAGGISACLHSFSPLSRGLFSAIIMESGNCGIYVRPASVANAIGDSFAQHIGCSSTDVACLMGKSVAQVMNASDAIGGHLIFSFDGTPSPVGFFFLMSGRGGEK